ncbi:Fmp10 protein [Saccharomycopsis crataegensis]|uniref:Fmp10 protein n=1 Tax=Saccharomycopsis crataegensis TaxID=43959 RepID=A0AAV5QTT9_9ASCO|nr:Fmp10 protein [Saccharomycopsis crataegensis]
MVFGSVFRRFASTTARSPKSGFFKAHWKLYTGTFVGGALTAHFVPVLSIVEYYLNSRLPKDGDPESIRNYTDSLEKKLASLKVVKELGNDKDWKQHRDWSYVSESKAANEVNNKSITEGALTIPGGFAIKPLIFENPKTNQTISVIYVGSRLCGYPFIVHGGVLATILDEVFKKSVGLNFNSDGEAKEFSTKHLELSYRFPTLANNFIVIKTNVGSDSGGIVAVDGNVKSLDGKLLIKGQGSVKILESDKKPNFIDDSKDEAKKGLKKLWPF